MSDIFFGEANEYLYRIWAWSGFFHVNGDTCSDVVMVGDIIPVWCRWINWVFNHLKHRIYSVYMYHHNCRGKMTYCISLILLQIYYCKRRVYNNDFNFSQDNTPYSCSFTRFTSTGKVECMRWMYYHTNIHYIRH
jgi:hypothetical protein